MSKERELLEAMLAPFDGEHCRYDHDDLCQAHFLDARPCPVERARAHLAATAKPVLAQGATHTTTRDVYLDLWHGGTPTRRSCQVEGSPHSVIGDAISLHDFFPDVLPDYTHDTHLRVTMTIEVINPGRACPIRKWQDDYSACTADRSKDKA